MVKKSKAKLPKTIAGVKVPKAVRTSTLVDELLISPLGREILAEAIVAAAGADGVDAPQRPLCAKVEVLKSTT